MAEERVEIYPGVTVDRKVQGGQPVIKGTRLPITTVLGQLAAGVGFEEICEQYAITTEEIRAALGYAATTLSRETVWAL